MTEAHKTIQTLHHGSSPAVSPAPAVPSSSSADVLPNGETAAALERQVEQLRERVADLQSDKILLEEEVKERAADTNKVNPPFPPTSVNIRV